MQRISGGSDVSDHKRQLRGREGPRRMYQIDKIIIIIIIIIAKKGLKECCNYWTISFISHMAKIILNVVLEGLQTSMGPFLGEEQAGWRTYRSTIQQILILRRMAEKSWRKKNQIYKTDS